MQTITLNRVFLKKPQNGLNTMVLVLMIAWGFNIIISPNILDRFSTSISVFKVFGLLIGIVVPELVSLFVLMIVINLYHDFIKAKELSLTFKSVIVYELKFAPLFLVAFFLFFPVTLHVRFFLREFPTYSLHKYYNVYLYNGFSINTYLMYLPFVSILGYILLNYSVIVDLLNSNIRTKIEPAPVEEIFESNNYLEKLKAKIETDGSSKWLLVDDCYYFLMENKRHYITNNVEGVFKISESITVLEKQLDPKIFFRCNRQTLININYIADIIYVDKGSYVIKMKTPTPVEFTIAKDPLKELKQLLKNAESRKLASAVMARKK